MEGEGEVLYRTVSWDRSLLAQHGRRPAGPLFNIECPQESVCQLHLPHCQIHSEGGCDFLSVAHVTDDGFELIPPVTITDSHVVINITGFSAFGNTDEERAPISPINALVLLFYQPPLVNQTRSILNVLLLPNNVIIQEVQHERRRRNGDKERYIESVSHCKLTPNQEYTLTMDPADAHTIKPNKAEFVTFDSYENYIPTFRMLFRTFVEEVNVLLKEIGASEHVWDDLVWLPASTATQEAPQPGPQPAFQSALSGPVFFRRHRASLQTRLCLLQPLLLRLQDKRVLIDEEREEVVSKPSQTLQKQALLDMLARKGEGAQEEFYQALKAIDVYLVLDLEDRQM
ncbi:NACHT, LRR and PYD domains-containing protein 1b allele 2-like [Osmerus eperlanus]|uniref:NACHT, LRR and PYD domains-containing protein 1b allele 2-like n=1 Tax=Osmerus eperlanus TaxID=29151 RepID=UPI002E150EFD